MGPPQRRCVHAQVLVLRPDDPVRNADVGQHHLAHVQPARKEQVARLQPAEGHRAARARGAAPRMAPVPPWTPDGTSTATTGRLPSEQMLDDGQGLTRERSVEAGAEERVDHELGPVQALHRNRLDRPLPA